MIFILQIVNHYLSMSTSTLIGLPNYAIYRNDRSIGEGGGVMILVEKSVTHKVCSDLYFADCESLFVDVYKSNGSKIRFGTIYRSSTPGQFNFEQMLINIEKASFGVSEFVLCGDFNYPKINWDLNYAVGYGNDTCFLNFCSEQGLYQFVREPTHFVENPTLLDLVLATDKINMQRVSVGEPFSSSKHGVISFCIQADVPALFASPSGFNFRKADYIGFQSFFDGLIWSDIFSDCDNIQSIWDRFLNVVNFGVESFVPKCKKLSLNHSFPLSVITEHLKRKKKHLWYDYKRSQSATSRLKYKRCCAEFRTSLNRDKIIFENRLLTGNNFSKVFNYVKKRLGSRDSIPILTGKLGDTVVFSESDQAKADILNFTFRDAFKSDNGIISKFSS